MSKSAWTWKRPTEPGFYWFKPKNSNSNYMRALQVYNIEPLPGQLFVACDRFSRLTSPYYDGGLWQKIPEPLP